MCVNLMDPPPNTKETQLTTSGGDLDPAKDKTLYFYLVQRQEVVCVPAAIGKTEFYELLCAAAEAAPGDIIKIYTKSGHLVNVAPDLPENSPETPYWLHLIASNRNSMLQRELGVDLVALDQRVCELERMVRPDSEDVSKAVANLRKQVETFRLKLENSAHQPARLELNKEEVNSPVKDEHNWVTLMQSNQLYYERRSAEERQIVCQKFLKICEGVLSEDVRLRLRQVTFDSREWEDEELLMLLQQMFLDLEFTTTFNLDLTTLRTFIFEVYDNYNDVPFHNFRHCFCVAQMMYSVVWAADLRNRLGDLEALILITSCICHDLDHPGYNNIYQINARTELALRYNDISPLENHHCSIAFRILCRPECNIFKDFSADQFRQLREGMIRCILATDMARHNEILEQFREITPVFDFSNTVHANLLTMVLIKVADISNEARPMEVAEPWLDRLLTEFFKQSDAEKLEGLPVTPFMDRDKVTKPSSQCSFIGLVLLPLFEALGQLLPELHDMIIKPVHFALDHYRRLNEAARERKSLDMELSMSDSGSQTAEAATSPTGSKRGSVSLGSGARLSRASIQSCGGFVIKKGSLEETEEEADVTEVDVSEKTLKFKISTESSKNYRKESLEKQSSVEASPLEEEAKPCKKQSFFSKLRFFRERLNGSSSISEKHQKKLTNRRKSSSSSDLNKQDYLSSSGSVKKNKVVLSGSLDCVLAPEEPQKKRLFHRLKSADGGRSPVKGKVATFVGSFRKNKRDDKSN